MFSYVPMLTLTSNGLLSIRFHQFPHHVHIIFTSCSPWKLPQLADLPVSPTPRGLPDICDPKRHRSCWEIPELNGGIAGKNINGYGLKHFCLGLLGGSRLILFDGFSHGCWPSRFNVKPIQRAIWGESASEFNVSGSILNLGWTTILDYLPINLSRDG